MSTQPLSFSDDTAAPRAPTPVAAQVQRERVTGQVRALRWLIALASLVATALFTFLAARQTAATFSNAAAPATPTTQQATNAANTPSQSLFTGNGSSGFSLGSGSSGGSSFFSAPPVRSVTS